MTAEVLASAGFGVGAAGAVALSGASGFDRLALKFADFASGEFDASDLAAAAASGAAGRLGLAPTDPSPSSSRVRLWSCGNNDPPAKQASAPATIKIGLKPDRRSHPLGRRTPSVSRGRRPRAPAPVSTQGDRAAKPVRCSVRSSGSNRFDGSRS